MLPSIDVFWYHLCEPIYSQNCFLRISRQLNISKNPEFIMANTESVSNSSNSISWAYRKGKKLASVRFHFYAMEFIIAIVYFSLSKISFYKISKSQPLIINVSSSQGKYTNSPLPLTPILYSLGSIYLSMLVKLYLLSVEEMKLLHYCIGRHKDVAFSVPCSKLIIHNVKKKHENFALSLIIFMWQPEKLGCLWSASAPKGRQSQGAPQTK